MDKLSVFFIIISSVLWGTAGLFTTQLREYGFTSMQMSGCRNIVAAVVMLIFVLMTNKSRLKAKPREILLFALSGVSIFATGSLYYAAMQATSLSTAVILMYTAPVIVMVVSVIFLNEAFNLKKLIAVVCALVGCGLVTGIIGGFRFSVNGIVLGLLSGVAYSIYNICVKVEMRRKNDPITANTYCFITAGLVSIFMMQPVKTIEHIAANPLASLLWILALGFFTSAFPYLIYTFAMKKLPAGVASAMASIEPMTATIISITVFGEKMTFSSVVGIVLILVAVLILSFTAEENEENRSGGCV